MDRTGNSNPMFGKKHSEQTKLKQKEMKMGKYTGSNNPMHGRTHSDVARGRISEAMKGMVWVTDGNISFKIKEGDPIPEGFIKGRKLKKNHYFKLDF